jgi:hypothetical protein
MNEQTINQGGQKVKTKAPKIPTADDYKKAVKALRVLRDFYQHDYHKDCKVEPKSFFGKKAKIIQDAINLLPASIRGYEKRNNYEEANS